MIQDKKRRSNEWDGWKKAIHTEFENMESKKVWIIKPKMNYQKEDN